MNVVQGNLFREEVIEARRVRLHGEVVLSRPLHAHLVISLLSISMVSLATWLVTGSYARTEVVKGVLATNSEAIKVVALHPGLITELATSEGRFVRRGDPLATVQLDQLFAQGGRATQESLRAVEAQESLASQNVVAVQEAARQKRASLAATIDSSRQKQSSVSAQISLQRQLINSLQRTVGLDRLAQLMAQSQ